MKTKLNMYLLFALLAVGICANAQSKSVLRDGVQFEVSRPTKPGALLHWKITNTLDTAIYVYNVYLWGPAYHVERTNNRIVLETTPVVQQPSCPPNRFPPVLLLAVGPHRSIEGDFEDPELQAAGDTVLSMRIAVGSDPYSVVREARTFMNSKCQHSPYDAIVRWGAILESNAIDMKPAAVNGTTPKR